MQNLKYWGGKWGERKITFIDNCLNQECHNQLIVDQMEIGKHEILFLSLPVFAFSCIRDLSLFWRCSNYGTLIQTLQYRVFPLRSVSENISFSSHGLLENKRVQIMFYQTMPENGKDLIMAGDIVLIFASDTRKLSFASKAHPGRVVQHQHYSNPPEHTRLKPTASFQA
jgi:hypothetical protein